MLASLDFLDSKYLRFVDVGTEKDCTEGAAAKPLPKAILIDPSISRGALLAKCSRRDERTLSHECLLLGKVVKSAIC